MDSFLTFSDKALNQLRKSCTEPEDILRITVNSGGCAGFEYFMGLDHTSDIDNTQDYVVKYNDFQYVIDKESSELLKGTNIDYEDGLQGKGFVFDNPNAMNSCGCGKSFS